MPIYEYRCSSCGFQKEYLKKVSDPLLSVCPECSQETFGKMLTAAGFQLKGGGWYATDFKNSGAKPAAKAAGKNGAVSKNETGGDSKTESSTTETQPTAVPVAAPAPASSAAKAE